MSGPKTQLAGKKRRRVEVQGYEKEVILQIIKTMMKCASGVDTHLFSYGPFDDYGNRSFNCHLCWVTNLLGLNDVRAHLKSDRHCKNLKRIPAITQFKLPLAVAHRYDKGSEKKYFKIFAGENIETPDPQIEQCYLPEFQWFLTDVDETIAKILSQDPMNDNSRKQTMFGVNFLGKMASATGEIQYFCFLCEEKLKIEENEGHFRSVDHELKYIKEFFPISHKKILDSFNDIEEAKKGAAVCDFFRNIYAELEAEHGFQNISVVSENDLNNNFTRLQSRIWSLDHYGESYSDYSENRVAAYVHKLLEAPKSYKEIKPPTDFIADTSFLTEQSTVAERQPPPKKRAHSDDIKSFIDRYELQKFKDKEVDIIKSRFKTFENDPKSYRSYSEEWNKFYQSRRAELEKKGTNLTSYNFQKDFKDWWKTRCGELTDIAIKEKLAEIDSGACRPPKKPENANLTTPVVKTTIKNPVATVIGGNKPIPTKSIAPPPPIWKGRGQEVVDMPAPSPMAVQNMTPIGNIPQLLLAIETFMTSLGPGILQLINQANSFKQGSDPNNIGKYAILCRQVETTLAANLADVNKLIIFKHAVKNLNAVVDAGSPCASTGTPYGPPGIPYGSNGGPNLPTGMSYAPNRMPYGPPGAPYGPTPTPYGPNGAQYGPTGTQGPIGGQHVPNQTPYRSAGTPEVEPPGKFPRPEIRQDSRNSMKVKNSSNESATPYKKPTITSLRQTTNPIFDFEKKTYGEVEEKEEDPDIIYIDDDNLSISSRRSQYRSGKQSPRNSSPMSNYSYKSDYGERPTSIQPTRQYMDRDGNIKSLENRNSMNIDSSNGSNTPSFGNQKRCFGNSLNSSQNLNRNQSDWASYRRNY